MIEISNQEFEEAVAEALKGLPEEFHSKLENIDIFIEDYPNQNTLEEIHVSKNGLLGLYSGVPQKYRNSPYYGNVLPDRIYLFKKNLERICRTRGELIDQVQRTVLHEIGHYFGLSDQRLRELGF